MIHSIIVFLIINCSTHLLFKCFQGVLEGAALDVFENEPLPSESELW